MNKKKQKWKRDAKHKKEEGVNVQFRARQEYLKERDHKFYTHCGFAHQKLQAHMFLQLWNFTTGSKLHTFSGKYGFVSTACTDTEIKSLHIFFKDYKSSQWYSRDKHKDIMYMML